MLTIGVIFGGPSGEYEVSCNSAGAICANLDHEKYNVVPIGMSKDGKMYASIKESDVKSFTADDYAENEVNLLAKPGGYLCLANGEIVAKLDAVIPIIHGTCGEDGVLQGLLELAQIPYVGAGVSGSAVGMDKILMRKILAFHDIPQTKFVCVSRHEVESDIEKVVAEAESKLKYPIFVKPANAGSSVGITKAHDPESLRAGITEAAKFDRRLLLEEGVNAREIEISVMGNDEPVCACAGEIIASNEFYDYKAKYIDNKSVAVIPAEITAEEYEKIVSYAKTAYQALDCAGLGRMDFFINRDNGAILLNEINTLPGFTEISMYAKLWAQSGLGFSELLDKLLAYAFERFQDKRRNVIDF